ncbi:hypothetical protein ACB098_06G031500 [Castanea mollissima]
MMNALHLDPQPDILTHCCTDLYKVLSHPKGFQFCTSQSLSLTVLHFLYFFLFHVPPLSLVPSSLKSLTLAPLFPSPLTHGLPRFIRYLSLIRLRLMERSRSYMSFGARKNGLSLFTALRRMMVHHMTRNMFHQFKYQQ